MNRRAARRLALLDVAVAAIERAEGTETFYADLALADRERVERELRSIATKLDRNASTLAPPDTVDPNQMTIFEEI